MPDETYTIKETTTEESTAAKIVSDAVVAAQRIVADAATVAAEQIKRENAANTETMANALREVFGENEDSKRFLDTQKIPFICKDIETIKISMKEMHDKLDNKFITVEAFWPVKTIVYAGAGLILIAVFSALVYSVIK